ncbi:MAG TPA: PAS domain S-box protein, partial [Cyanophyceae cyanobacterium]
MNTPKTQMQLVEKLTQAESALSQFFRLSLDLFSIQGNDGYFKQLSPAWEKILGWTDVELHLQRGIEFVHPDDVEVTENAYKRCYHSDVVEYENRYRHKNGSYRWLTWRVSRGEDGLFYSVAKDITATKQLEVALSDRLNRWVSEEVTVAQLSSSTSGSNSTDVSLSTPSTIHPEIKQERLQQEVAESALQAVVELEMRVETRTAELQQLNQQLKAEIVEHQRTEAALEKSKEQFRQVFDEAPIGMVLRSLDNRFIRVNQSLCKMLGYTQSELMTLTAPEVTHPENWQQELSYLRQIEQGEIDGFQLEKRYRTKNQGILWGNLTTMSLKDEAGKILYILGMIEDITQYKQTLEALCQSEARYRAIVEDQTEL